MSFVRSQFVVALLLIVSLVAPGLAFGQTKRHHKGSAVKKQVQPPPDPAPQPPPPPPTPEQLPAVPPNVTYQYGLLTIVARNSVLSDILRAVHAKTGANIDIPPGANERVVGQIGPGPARDVLAKLLNGTHFNYVMLGTAANPNAVAQIILTPNSGPETPPTQNSRAGAMQQPGMPQPYPNQPFPNQPDPQAGQAQNPAEQGMGADGGELDNAQENVEGTSEESSGEEANGEENQQNPNQPVVKTPEQLLQELQRQQQMQQQQQQGQQSGSPQGEPQQPQPQPQVVYPNPQQYPPQQQQQPPQQDK